MIIKDPKHLNNRLFKLYIVPAKRLDTPKVNIDFYEES